MSTDTKRPFWEAKNHSFVEAAPGCDLLHPEARTQEPGDSLTETQYFGFNIAEENIHAICYLWHHPNLGVVTGGAWVWQGVKQHNFQSEIFDLRTYMNDGCLANDLWDYRLDNGYHVTTLEPLKRHRIRYTDAARDNHFDIELEAVTPAVVLDTGKHFEQGVRARGELTLRGKRYDVDCFNVRDRSWGQLRPEDHVSAPPLDWMNCAFGDDLAFSATAFDDLPSSPEWAGSFELPGGDNLKGGWIWRDGGLVAVVAVRKRTYRDPHNLFPTRTQMTITDANGRHHELQGEVTAVANWRAWHNFDAIMCSVRWTLRTPSGDRVGQGDMQEFQWADYVRKFTGDPTGAIAARA